jgi:signal transduction histidine kinase
VDAVRLAQVISNLLLNVAKYTEANAKLHLRAWCEGSHAVLTVTDNGIGIASDVLAHIFDLFVQADYSYTKSHGGLGIGLTLVRNLVEMHGGTVSAFSEGLGKGSQFQIRLFTNTSRDQALSENSSSGS